MECQEYDIKHDMQLIRLEKLCIYNSKNAPVNQFKGQILSLNRNGVTAV